MTETEQQAFLENLFGPKPEEQEARRAWKALAFSYIYNPGMKAEFYERQAAGRLSREPLSENYVFYSLEDQKIITEWYERVEKKRQEMVVSVQQES